MSTELDLLLAERAVESAIVELFVATDKRDWESVERVFANEVLFDMSSLGAGDATRLAAAAITAMWDEGLRPLDAVHHQAGNFQVSVNGDEASASCYGIAFHYLANQPGGNTRTFVGSYDFHLARVDDAWRIDELRFNCKFIDGNLELGT